MHAFRYFTDSLVDEALSAKEKTFSDASKIFKVGCFPKLDLYKSVPLSILTFLGYLSHRFGCLIRICWLLVWLRNSLFILLDWIGYFRYRKSKRLRKRWTIISRQWGRSSAFPASNTKPFRKTRYSLRHLRIFIDTHRRTYIDTLIDVWQFQMPHYPPLFILCSGSIWWKWRGISSVAFQTIGSKWTLSKPPSAIALLSSLYYISYIHILPVFKILISLILFNLIGESGGASAVAGARRPRRQDFLGAVSRALCFILC